MATLLFMPESAGKSADYSSRATLIERRIPSECAGLRVDQALARLFPQFSRSRLAAWLREGRIRIDERALEPDQRVWGGEGVELLPVPDPRGAPPEAEAIELSVVHEDESVLVIDKPAGLVVHPGSGNWSGTLLNALLHHASELAGLPRAGIVHRLDKDTSGLLVVAKTLEAQTALVRQMQSRTVERIYLALVHGVVARDGSVESPIGRDPRHRTRMAVVSGGRPALTRFQVVKRFEQASLLECTLATGRTHQIRVHLHSIAHPLVGDPVYRSSRHPSAPDALAHFARQALHATRLSFDHPSSGRRRVFRSPLPADIASLLAALEQERQGAKRARA
jgi:23S rRNA pseudouridine1911/1915/1917 synthase